MLIGLSGLSVALIGYFTILCERRHAGYPIHRKHCRCCCCCCLSCLVLSCLVLSCLVLTRYQCVANLRDFADVTAAKAVEAATLAPEATRDQMAAGSLFSLQP